VVNQVGLVLRYSPVFTVMKEMMSEPGLGPLLTAHLRDDQFFPIRGHYGSSWRGSFERAGGGTLIEHSIHDVDLFRWLFGDITRVRCHTRYTTGHDGVEDVAIATFQHADGHQTSLSSVWHALDDRPSTRHLEVFFEGGYFATDHDFLGPIRYQGRTGRCTKCPPSRSFDRYVEIAGLEGSEATWPAPACTGLRVPPRVTRAARRSRTSGPRCGARGSRRCYRSGVRAGRSGWQSYSPDYGWGVDSRLPVDRAGVSSAHTCGLPHPRRDARVPAPERALTHDDRHPEGPLPIGEAPPLGHVPEKMHAR